MALEQASSATAPCRDESPATREGPAEGPVGLLAVVSGHTGWDWKYRGLVVSAPGTVAARMADRRSPEAAVPQQGGFEVEAMRQG